MVPIHRVQHLTSTDEIFGKRRVREGLLALEKQLADYRVIGVGELLEVVVLDRALRGSPA